MSPSDIAAAAVVIWVVVEVVGRSCEGWMSETGAVVSASCGVGRLYSRHVGELRSRVVGSRAEDSLS